MEDDDALRLAKQRMDDLRHEVRLLAAPADEQATWLASQAVPVAEDELVLSFLDTWPLWQQILSPVMTPRAAAALDEFEAWVTSHEVGILDDVVKSLSKPEWDDIRRKAGALLEVLADL
jgi:hypothetical protein